MKRARAKEQYKRNILYVAVMSALSGNAGANPTGAQVVSGQATIATQGSVLTVANSPNAILNWQSFSIGAGETTRFIQQSAASAVLNRVVGVDPSVILGTLQSNGRVFLVNPSGIVFGQGARIDVAGLVASTLNLNNQDFLATPSRSRPRISGPQRQAKGPGSNSSRDLDWNITAFAPWVPMANRAQATFRTRFRVQLTS